MNILTFDIEDWFHILDNDSTKSESEWIKYPSRLQENIDRIFLLLEETKTRATFFCLGWVAQKYPSIIKDIVNRGYEIGCHSNMHQLVYEQTTEEYKNDLITSFSILENISGKKIRYYRAPGFSITNTNNWAFELLAENGIEYDSSIFPAQRGHGGYKGYNNNGPAILDINGMQIKEFPINTINVLGKRLVFTGGGYFRLFPLLVLKYLFSDSDYIMTYFHPRDFDFGQPMIDGLSLIRKFKSYYGLSSTLSKLKSILLTYHFVDIKEASSLIKWDNTNIVKLE
jgi:polysaccharide deacetylase family protein (PEP-CTERM system associated)